MMYLMAVSACAVVANMQPTTQRAANMCIVGVILIASIYMGRDR